MIDIPEAVRASVSSAQLKALTRITADLLNGNEPLLSVEIGSDQKHLIVSEKGGPGRYKITVEAL